MAADTARVCVYILCIYTYIMYILYILCIYTHPLEKQLEAVRLFFPPCCQEWTVCSLKKKLTEN